MSNSPQASTSSVEAITGMEINIFKASTSFSLEVVRALKQESEKLSVSNLGNRSLVIYNLTNLLHDTTRFNEMVRRRAYSLFEDLPANTSLMLMAIFHGEVQLHRLFGNDVAELEQTLKSLEEEIYKYVIYIKALIPKGNFAKIKENVNTCLDKALVMIDELMKDIAKNSDLAKTDNETLKMLTNQLINVANQLRLDVVRLKEKLAQSNEDLDALTNDIIELLKTSATAGGIADAIDEDFYQHNKTLGIYKYMHEVIESLASNFIGDW
ncbi:MAG: hypothetical protein QXV17_10595 [Candidatus Micrarchaeaceae archaeon]